MFRRPAAYHPAAYRPAAYRPMTGRLIPLALSVGLATNLTGCFKEGFAFGYVAGAMIMGNPVEGGGNADGGGERERASAPPKWTSPPRSTASSTSRPTSSPLQPAPGPRSPERNTAEPASDGDLFDRQLADYNRRNAAREARERAERERLAAEGGASVPATAADAQTPIAAASDPAGTQDAGMSDAGMSGAGMADPGPVADANAGEPPSLRAPAPGESETAWAVRVLNTATAADWVPRRKAMDYLADLDPATATAPQRGPIAAALTGRLTDAVQEGGFGVDRAAATLLRWADRPEQFRTIGESLLEGTGAGRKEALKNLDPQNPAHAYLAAALLPHDWEGDEATAVLRTMGRIAEPAALPLLAHPDAATRRDAATLLAEIGGPASAEALKTQAAAETDRTLARHLRAQRIKVLKRAE